MNCPDLRMNEHTNAMTRDNLWKKAFRKFLRDRVGMLALLVVSLYGIIALGVVLGLWAQDWDELLTEERVGPSLQYWFGTNINGQDGQSGHTRRHASRRRHHQLPECRTSLLRLG